MIERMQSLLLYRWFIWLHTKRSRSWVSWRCLSYLPNFPFLWFCHPSFSRQQRFWFVSQPAILDSYTRQFQRGQDASGWPVRGACDFLLWLGRVALCVPAPWDGRGFWWFCDGWMVGQRILEWFGVVKWLAQSILKSKWCRVQHSWWPGGCQQLDVVDRDWCVKAHSVWVFEHPDWGTARIL